MTADKPTEPDFYTCYSDAETLHCTQLDEAVEEYIDEGDLCDGVVVVFQHKRRVLLPDEWALNPDEILSETLQRLDEEYGGGDDEVSPTLAMLEAARALADVIRREYEPWQCELLAETITVDVAKWIKENRPDWLENAR